MSERELICVVLIIIWVGVWWAMCIHAYNTDDDNAIVPYTCGFLWPIAGGIALIFWLIVALPSKGIDRLRGKRNV